ncbi:MAG: MFS transporter [Myxococcota bacterium]|jgi:EmrB/QacA subfamily drug resistance transporter
MQRKEWFLLISAAFGTFLFSLDSSVVNLAIPVLSRHFGVGTSEISFVSTAFLLTVSSSLLLSAQLTKQFDFRKVVIGGHLIFLVSTIACGLSQDVWLLIFFRVLQGAGASILVIGGFNSVPRFLPAEWMGFGLGIISSSLAVGMVAGYPLGGFITAVLPWNYVFFLQVPLILISLAMAWKSFPTAAAHRPVARNFDVAGAVLFFLMFCSLTFSTSMGEKIGWTSPSILSGFGFFLFFLVLLVRRELRIPYPFLDPAIFRNRTYSLVMSGRLFVGMLQYGNLFLFPFYLKYCQNMTQDRIGLLFLAYAISYIMLAPVSGVLADRFKPTRVSAVALFLLLFSSLFFLCMADRPGQAWIAVYLFSLSAGFALFYPANNKYVVLIVPPDKRDASVGIFTTVWISGQSLGVSLFELVFSTSLFLSAYSAHSIAGAFEKIAPGTLLGSFRLAYGAGAAVIVLGMILIFAGFRTRK